jgi:hypothetical protein
MITVVKQSWSVCLKVGSWNELERLDCHQKNGPLPELWPESNQFQLFLRVSVSKFKQILKDLEAGILRDSKINSGTVFQLSSGFEHLQ